ncbi:PRC-barrel domain-containing protein [Sphingomonas sp. NIBR02145]|uniref:PRC-barrel domain-containing protein n=1 Tax=Sphingomonas sp. NIBR02145 TaxID=3014784 RepID=UPI0022B5B2A2|nr:PRC-barrel domain-containing protein [Sphingomonas sp. NIBR02145]WHU02459.1 PRC-barrel domain-containing protein [Sphingomonas sp. NIBR02145]
MIAAMMTAANLGARLTGWGFVVFTVGSLGWATVGLSSGQTNLLATNCFLTLVNAVGIWRWLGRQRVYEDGGKSASQASRRAAAPSLFTATGLAGMPVVDSVGDRVGKAVEGLVECATGEISYVVVASGPPTGIGEALRAVPRQAIRFGCDFLALDMPRNLFDAIEPLDGGDWPVKVVLDHAS